MIALEPVSIVVVGAGLIGPRHAQHIKEHKNARLFGIVDPSAIGRKVAEDYNTDYFDSISAMINHCDNQGIAYPHGAVVATPNATHIRVAAELASHGIHLLVEKPLSSRAEESEALKRYCAEKNVHLLVGHHRRFNPFIIETKKHLQTLGTIVALQGTWTLCKPDDYFLASPWRTSNESGGGTLLINLVHDIDILQYLFGPVERVYAEVLQKQRDHYPEADEGAALTLRFVSGVCGTFVCCDSVISPFNFESGTGENPNIPFHEQLEGFYRVYGTNGTLSVPDMHLYHQQHTLEKTWNQPVIRERVSPHPEVLRSKHPFDLQLDHFLNVINGSELPLCTAEDGIQAQLCINAVMNSIKTGLPQTIPSTSSIHPDYKALNI